MSSSTNQNDSTSQRVDKRVRYFPGQSLGAEDYQAEQTYHMDRQRSHSRWLHAAGICEGLTVTFDKDNSRLTVSPGTAVDGQGRQIVLAEERHKEDLPDQGTVRVYVSYNEEQSDQAGAGENEGHNMRWHEWPVIEVVEAGGKPEGTDPILLAEVDNAAGQVDHSVRRYAGLRLPGGETGGQAVALRATPSGQAELSGELADLTVSGATKLEGDLAVSGNVGIGTAAPKSPLSVSGGAAIGVEYATKTAPASGLIVQGQVGIGTTSPEATLDIRGTLKANVMMAGLMFRGEEKNYVEIPEMNPDYAKGFTVEAWVRYRSLQHWSRIIDFGNGAGKDNIFLANRETTTDLWFEVHRDGEKLAVGAARALETGTWMHLAATVHGSGQAKLYKNGQLLATATVPVPATLNRTKNYIGRSNWDEDDYFDGWIAEVAIWNGARTEAEINHDMNKKLSGSEDGLVGYWPCDEGADKQVKDKAREQHHGTIHGATWFQEDIPAITIARYGNVGIGTKEPKSPLSVTGNIGLGPDASLYAPGGVENLMLIRGTVAPNGDILVGQGFQVEHSGTGLYNITFSPAFSAKPTVVVTQQHPDKDDFEDTGGWLTDNCVVVAVSDTRCRIKCGGGQTAIDRRFHFTALGPR